MEDVNKLSRFLNEHGLRALAKYVAWCHGKQLTPTPMGLGAWLANERGGGERDNSVRGVGGVGGGTYCAVHIRGNSNIQHHVGELGSKITAYREFASKGMGQWYLETCCTPAERRGILDGEQGNENRQGD